MCKSIIGNSSDTLYSMHCCNKIFDLLSIEITDTNRIASIYCPFVKLLIATIVRAFVINDAHSAIIRYNFSSIFSSVENCTQSIPKHFCHQPTKSILVHFNWIANDCLFILLTAISCHSVDFINLFKFKFEVVELMTLLFGFKYCFNCILIFVFLFYFNFHFEFDYDFDFNFICRNEKFCLIPILCTHQP